MSSEDAELYVQRYNMLLETVRVFSVTLEQEHGAITGEEQLSPEDIIHAHFEDQYNEMAEIAMELVLQLETLRSFIKARPQLLQSFLEARKF